MYRRWLTRCPTYRLLDFASVVILTIAVFCIYIIAPLLADESYVLAIGGFRPKPAPPLLKAVEREKVAALKYPKPRSVLDREQTQT